jgi:mannose-6-phosphate isomerase-like protein (cupin superfamily)
VSDFTILNLRDVEDAAPKFGLGDTIQARFARRVLEMERTGVSLQRLAPGARSPFGHRHAGQEETYVILDGTGRVKLGDELRDVGPLDAVRVAPHVWRAFEAGPDGLEYLAFGGPTGEGNDSEIDPGWWPA